MKASPQRPNPRRRCASPRIPRGTPSTAATDRGLHVFPHRTSNRPKTRPPPWPAGVIRRPQRPPPVPEPPFRPGVEPHPAAAEANADFTWRKRIHERLLDTIDPPGAISNRHVGRRVARRDHRACTRIIAAGPRFQAGSTANSLCERVLDEAIGLGPPRDPARRRVGERIMVKSLRPVFAERGGRIAPHPTTFTSDARCSASSSASSRRSAAASTNPRRWSMPGARRLVVNAIIRRSPSGPTLTIRKFARRALRSRTSSAWVRSRTRWLHSCAPANSDGKNVVVSGGTGSGKTTFPQPAVELHPRRRTHHHHRGRRAAPAPQPPGQPGGAPVQPGRARRDQHPRPRAQRVAHAPRPHRGGRMPRRRGARHAAGDEHRPRGSMTTLHANSPRDALSPARDARPDGRHGSPAGRDPRADRQRGGHHRPADPLRLQRAPAHQHTELTGMEGGRIQLQELFRFERRSADSPPPTRAAATSPAAMPCRASTTNCAARVCARPAPVRPEAVMTIPWLRHPPCLLATLLRRLSPCSPGRQCASPEQCARTLPRTLHRRGPPAARRTLPVHGPGATLRPEPPRGHRRRHRQLARQRQVLIALASAVCWPATASCLRTAAPAPARPHRTAAARRAAGDRRRPARRVSMTRGAAATRP